MTHAELLAEVERLKNIIKQAGLMDLQEFEGEVVARGPKVIYGNRQILNVAVDPMLIVPYNTKLIMRKKNE